jgi:hypothetical protein
MDAAGQSAAPLLPAGIVRDLQGVVMGTGLLDVDPIEEFRLRRWARENYVPNEQRDRAWHPIVHEEMRRKDGETSDAVLVG